MLVATATMMAMKCNRVGATTIAMNKYMALRVVNMLTLMLAAPTLMMMVMPHLMELNDALRLLTPITLLPTHAEHIIVPPMNEDGIAISIMLNNEEKANAQMKMRPTKKAHNKVEDNDEDEGAVAVVNGNDEDGDGACGGAGDKWLRYMIRLYAGVATMGMEMEQWR